MQQRFFDINPIDKKFREGLENFAVQPRKRMWYRIESELDQTGKKSFGRRRTFFAAGVISVAALVGTALFVPDSTKKITREDVKIENTIASSNLNQKASKQNISSITKNNIVVAPTPKQLETLNSNINRSINYLNKILNGLDRREVATERIEMEKIPPHSFAELEGSNSKLQTLSFKKINLNKNLIAENQIPSNKLKVPSIKLQAPNSSLNNFCIKGFYIGVGSAVNFTKLMDKRAKANENFHYFVTLGTSYSVKAGYNFSEKFGIEAAWNIKSTQGQKYNFIPYSISRIDEDFRKNRLTLTYTQVPVVAKYKFSKVSRVTKCPVVLNLEGGAQYGYLKSEEKTFQNDLTKNDKFRTSEIAAIAGIGYDIYFTPKLSLNIGARATYGTSIFSSSVSEYNEFAAPHNFVAGGNIGLSYSFSKCK